MPIPPPTQQESVPSGHSRSGGRHARWRRRLVSGCLALAGLACARAGDAVVVNCALPADPPLVRKFGLANSCAVPPSRYERDQPALGLLHPDSCRVELGLGRPGAGWTKPILGGTPGNVQYDWTELDAVAGILTKQGVLPAFCHCYTPEVLQRDGWNLPPANLSQWAGFVRELAEHYRTAGIRLAGHEIWNRPDDPLCFEATRGIYFQLYKLTALALREGDPDAVIGAPAIAMRAEWIQPFVDFVDFDRLPLDFFSFQTVPSITSESTWGPVQTRLKNIRAALAKSARLATTEIRLSAFNPLPRAELRPGGALEQPALASTILDGIEQFLGETDLTAVNWASLMDAGGKQEQLGLLGETGEPRPGLGAFAIYADLPVDRCAAKAPAPLHVLAARNAERAGAVVWNPAATAQPARVQLDALPFADGQVRILRLDNAHPLSLVRSNAWSLRPQESQPFQGSNFVWQGDLPAGGLVYLRAESAAAPAPAAFTPPAELVRLHRYFPQRDKSIYSDFDRADWTVRLGMGTEDRGVAMIGLNLARCPTNLQVTLRTSGSPRKLDKDSLLAVRVDLFDRGSFTQSVLFHAGLYDPTTATHWPWGTGKPPLRVVQVPTDRPWTLSLAGMIPDSWRQRAIVTFLLQNAGNGARASFSLSKTP